MYDDKFRRNETPVTVRGAHVHVHVCLLEEVAPADIGIWCEFNPPCRLIPLELSIGDCINESGLLQSVVVGPFRHPQGHPACEHFVTAQDVLWRSNLV